MTSWAALTSHSYRTSRTLLAAWGACQAWAATWAALAGWAAWEVRRVGGVGKRVAALGNACWGAAAGGWMLGRHIPLGMHVANQRCWEECHASCAGSLLLTGTCC